MQKNQKFINTDAIFSSSPSREASYQHLLARIIYSTMRFRYPAADSRQRRVMADSVNSTCCPLTAGMLKCQRYTIFANVGIVE